MGDCYLKIFSKQLLLNMWSLPLSFIVSVHGGVVEIISSGGKQNIENNPPSSYKNPYNRAAVLPRGRNMQGMMPMPRIYHHSYSSNQYGYKRHQMSTYGNQPQRYPHQWEPSQIRCGSTPSGTKYQQHRLIWWRRAIPDERMPSTTKGKKCEDRCTHSEGTSVKWKW